jgi:hypothetical protein
MVGLSDMVRAVIALLLLASTILLLPRAAAAQSAPYVAAIGAAEIKFGTSPSIFPFSQEESLDSTGAGGGLRVGTFLHPRWSLELSVDAGSRTQVEVENPVMILIFPPPPRAALRASTSYVTVSTLVGFHPAAIGRVRLGYRAGFSFVRGTYESDYPSFFPVPLFTSGATTSGVVSSILPSPRINPVSATRKDNAGALTLGFDAAIDMTRRLALVPEVRALVFSAPSNGPVIFLIRPGVGIRWNF